MDLYRCRDNRDSNVLKTKSLFLIRFLYQLTYADLGNPKQAHFLTLNRDKLYVVCANIR